MHLSHRFDTMEHHPWCVWKWQKLWGHDLCSLLPNQPDRAVWERSVWLNPLPKWRKLSENVSYKLHMHLSCHPWRFDVWDRERSLQCNYLSEQWNLSESHTTGAQLHMSQHPWRGSVPDWKGPLWWDTLSEWWNLSKTLSIQLQLHLSQHSWGQPMPDWKRPLRRDTLSEWRNLPEAHPVGLQLHLPIHPQRDDMWSWGQPMWSLSEWRHMSQGCSWGLHWVQLHLSGFVPRFETVWQNIPQAAHFHRTWEKTEN